MLDLRVPSHYVYVLSARSGPRGTWQLPAECACVDVGSRVQQEGWWMGSKMDGVVGKRGQSKLVGRLIFTPLLPELL